MKKKISTNAITRWLGGWVSQTELVENNVNKTLDVFFSIRRPKQTTQEELKSFKFASFMYY